MEIAKTGAYVAALVIAFIIMGVLYPFNKVAAFVVAAFIFIVIAIHLYLGLLFRYQTLIRQNLGPIQAMKASYRLFLDHKGIAFTTAVLVLVTFTVIDLIRSVLVLLIRSDATIIFSVLYLIVAVWSFTYLFTIYSTPTLALPQKTTTSKSKPTRTTVKRSASRSQKRTKRRR